MPVTVAVNQLTVVHSQSNGMVSFMPDVCLTPAPPAGPVPIPYPNIAMSQDADKGSRNVTANGQPMMLEGSCFSQSTGDEAGSAGGVMSSKTKGAADFLGHSFDVKVEGKFVARATDLMLGNKGGTYNTPPMPEIQPPMPCVLPPEPGEQEEQDSLEVQVVSRAGKALADVRYVLKTSDGKSKEGRTDSSGKIKLDKTVSGSGQITLPDYPGVELKVE